MSEMRRRRVMLDSDDEDQDEEVVMKRRITPPSAAGSAKKRRLEVSALNDDADDGDGIIFEGLALEDSSEDDQMERKRRRQLAERWSKLEKDSDHELSGDEKGGGGGLARLRAQNPWKRSTRSRDAIRLLMKGPVSPRSGGEEDEESDDLDGFIVNSPVSGKEASVARGRNRSDSLSSSQSSASPSKGRVGSSKKEGKNMKSRGKKPAAGTSTDIVDSKSVDKNRSRRNRHRNRRHRRRGEQQSASPSSSESEETLREGELSSDGKAAACSSSEEEGQTEQDAGRSGSRRGARTGGLVDTRGKGKGGRGKRGSGVVQQKVATDDDSCVEEPSGASRSKGKVKRHSGGEGKGVNNESTKGGKKRSTRSGGTGEMEGPGGGRSSKADAAIAVDSSSDGDDVEGCNRSDEDIDDNKDEEDDDQKEEGGAVRRTSKLKTSVKKSEAKVERKSSLRRKTRGNKGDDGDRDNEEDDEPKVEDGEDGGTVRSASKRKMKMKNKAKKEGKMRAKKGDDDDEDNEEDDEPKVEDGDEGTVRSASKRRMKMKNTAKKERKMRAKEGDDDEDNEEDDEPKVEDGEDRGTVQRASKHDMKKNKAKKKMRAKKGDDDDEDNEDDDEQEVAKDGKQEGTARRTLKQKRAKEERKSSSRRKTKAKRGDDNNGDNDDWSDESEATVPPSKARAANARRRRTSSLVNRREGGSRGSIGEEAEGDDDEEDKENVKEFEERCGVDEDADFDDDFAENLRDDYEDDSGSSYGGDALRTRGGWSGRREDGDRGGRYGHHDSEEEDEEEEDSSDAERDYDSEEDEGDASFSHAAFFHEMERSQDIGISSLSMETMTLHDAFLFYVEYLAKATADEGAGEAFMEKMVAQPRLPEHARYSRAREMVEKKVCISRESLCGTWRQDFRDSILRYPHYVYQRVDTTVARQCGACNRRSPTAIVAFLSGSSYDPRRVWDGLRWDKYLPEHWDNPNAMALLKQKAQATHFLGQTCRHKSHLYHSLAHYKLYLVSKVAEKMRWGNGLEPENFRGIGGPRTSKKKKKLLLNFSENEYESLKSLLKKAQELNGVKWGSQVGLRGGGGKTFLQAGAASSILDWLSGELRPGQYEGIEGLEERPEPSEDDSEGNSNEEEFSVGRGRLWRTVGSSGGRYG